ncbi:hypothetical protein OG21DRAFT_274261 [Imleria badia]|nr:hypothetical protein OG21DRAFT_274261 [Imleria badia]
MTFDGILIFGMVCNCMSMAEPWSVRPGAHNFGCKLKQRSFFFRLYLVVRSLSHDVFVDCCYCGSLHAIHHSSFLLFNIVVCRVWSDGCCRPSSCLWTPLEGDRTNRAVGLRAFLYHYLYKRAECRH